MKQESPSKPSPAKVRSQKTLKDDLGVQKQTSELTPFQEEAGNKTQLRTKAGLDVTVTRGGGQAEAIAPKPVLASK
jgi:hypothetical protein